MADFSLTPAADTPTITCPAVGASAVPSISGSAGWFREKRSGVAEGAAGAAQTSTAALDLTGSTRFRYPVVPGATGHTANPGNYVWTDQKPGSTSSVQNAKWLFNVEFVTDSPQVQIRLRAPVAAPPTMILVNGRRVQEGNVITSGLTAGSGYGLLLTFPAAGTRTITLRGLFSIEGDFGGVAVSPGYTVVKSTPTITRRVAIIGDSYVNGAGTYATSGASATETFAWRLAALMGADEILQAGIGGTGWVTQLSTGTDSLFQARIAPVMAMNPHVVIFAGGRNDSASGLQAAVATALDSVGTGVERYVLPTASEASQADVRAAIAAACASRGVRYGDVPVDTMPKISDGIHMTYPGHTTYADNSYAALAPATAVSGSGAISGTGTVLSAGSPRPAASTDISGSGSVAAAGSPQVAAPAGISGSGSVSATGSASSVASGSGALSGTGVVSASGAPATSSTGALQGSGTVTATGQPRPAAAVGLQGAGVVSATGSASQAGSAAGAISGTGSVTATGQPRTSSTAGIAGAGTVTATGGGSSVVAVTISGTGTITATGLPTPTTTSTLQGLGTVAAAGTPSTSTSTGIAGVGVLTAAGAARIAQSAALVGLGVVAAVGRQVIPSDSVPAIRVTATSRAPVELTAYARQSGLAATAR